jgi:hypothetical protein
MAMSAGGWRDRRLWSWHAAWSPESLAAKAGVLNTYSLETTTRHGSSDSILFIDLLTAKQMWLMSYTALSDSDVTSVWWLVIIVWYKYSLSNLWSWNVSIMAPTVCICPGRNKCDIVYCVIQFIHSISVCVASEVTYLCLMTEDIDLVINLCDWSWLFTVSWRLTVAEENVQREIWLYSSYWPW